MALVDTTGVMLEPIKYEIGLRDTCRGSCDLECAVSLISSCCWLRLSRIPPTSLNPEEQEEAED
jgi:hypothetical protein